MGATKKQRAMMKRLFDALDRKHDTESGYSEWVYNTAGNELKKVMLFMGKRALEMEELNV